MAFRIAVVCGVIGSAVLGASAASAQPVLRYHHGHHRFHHYSHVEVDAPPVVPEGYAYGGYEREPAVPYGYPPGYGPGYAPGAGYFIAPGLGLDGPGYGYNGY